MVSVYRPLSPLSPHCTQCSHREFQDLSDRIPSPPQSKALVGKRTQIVSDRKPGETLTVVKIPESPTWRLYGKETPVSCDSHHSAETQGNWLCGKTILGSGRGEEKDPKALFMLCVQFVWLSVKHCHGRSEISFTPHKPTTYVGMEEGKYWTSNTVYRVVSAWWSRFWLT